MIEKKALTSVPINELLASRWSGRAYAADKPVDHKDLQSLLEAARWAPSCFGDEPWRYIVCDRFSNESAWQRVCDCLAEGNRSWAVNAPVLILVCAHSIFSGNGKPNRWGEYDTGAASMSICLEAVSRGLMVHQMGGYDADKAREAFHVPDRFTTMAMMAVGYQLPENELPDDIRDRELSARRRSEHEKLFFAGDWDEAFVFTGD